MGDLQKAKRKLENSVCEILEKNGFEEILTPNFSYSQHQAIANERKLIKFSDEDNEQVSLGLILLWMLCELSQKIRKNYKS